MYSQVGDSSPDVSASSLRSAFNAIQELVGAGALLAGHDRSDGGLLTAVLEMAFAGNWWVCLNLRTVYQQVMALHCSFETLLSFLYASCDKHATRIAVHMMGQMIRTSIEARTIRF